MAQKVYDQAEIVFEKLASSRDPEIIVRAEFLRGVLAHRRGDNDQARGIFRNVIERVPNIDLANQALFNLSEVYGDEERYMDQLNLLMTVGRLGRVSKRQHAPGMPLSHRCSGQRSGDQSRTQSCTSDCQDRARW